MMRDAGYKFERGDIRFTIVENAKCGTCKNTTDCFRWYDLGETGEPRIVLTQCHECDLETDPRSAELVEDLENIDNWKN